MKETTVKTTYRIRKHVSIDAAKNAITKYNRYHNQLNQNGMIVDKFELN